MVYRLKTDVPFGNGKLSGCRLGLAVACTSLCMGAAGAQQPRARFALGPAQVVLAMERLQLPTRGVQVRLAAPVTSTSADTRLEIVSTVLVNPREMRLRIACSGRSECLPFFAVATYPDADGLAGVAMKQDGKAAGPARAAETAKDVQAAAAAKAPLLRSGSPATLDLDSERVHVRIAVVCLESGASGDKVRVATRDRKQMYVAEVVTSTLLKGTF